MQSQAESLLCQPVPKAIADCMYVHFMVVWVRTSAPYGRFWRLINNRISGTDIERMGSCAALITIFWFAKTTPMVGAAIAEAD
jgi:hypothetical protein